MIPSACVDVTTDSFVKVSDPKSTAAIFVNPARDAFTRIRVDGCVVRNRTACDWLVSKSDVGTIAVELKGSDVDHAAEQVFVGFAVARAYGNSPVKLAGLIVCTRYPRVDTKVQRIKQRAAKQFEAPIHVKTDGRGLDFDQLMRF